MTPPLILGVDSGLDGAFCWMRGGKVLHTVLTRTLVQDGRIDMGALSVGAVAAWDAPAVRPIAYLEEPFNAAIKGGSYSSGYTDQCKRWGRLQGWLESWGYEVRGVQAKTWQRELLDLSKFEVWTEKPCAPRLAKGWTLKATSMQGNPAWALRNADGVAVYNRREGQSIAGTIAAFAVIRPECVTTTKSVLSHDTKAASIAYVREHYPGVDLVPPRCKNPHDGLADAVCIAAWASKQLSKET